MPALAKSSFDATVRHQVLLERLKAGEIRKILPFLRQMDREVRLRLSGDELTQFSRARLTILLAETESLITGILQRYNRQLLLDLREMGESEALFEARSLTNAVSNPDFDAVAPASSQVWAAAMAAPLSIRGVQGGKLIEPFLADFTKAQVDRVIGTIRQGAYEGRTNADIVRTIRGTKALKYSDGILAIADRQAQAVVRTSVQHISSVARMQTYAANADLVKEYEWLSTLDNRTSEICQGLSGTRWKVNEGPVPPAHINCRSTTVPVLDERFDFLKEGATQSAQFGPVDADQTYFDWLKNQPAKFQDSVLGPIRGKLLRDGGLTAERFQQLRLSRDFKPLTLAEMQKLEPLAFEQAGITINPDTGRVVNAAKAAASIGPAIIALAAPDPLNLVKKGGITSAALSGILHALPDAGPQAAKFTKIMNTHGISSMFTSPGNVRGRTSFRKVKDQWSQWVSTLGPSPSGHQGERGGWPLSRSNALGYTSQSWNYVVTKLPAGLVDFSKINPTKLRQAVRKALELHAGGDAVKGWTFSDIAKGMEKELGKGANQFLVWLHEMGHQVHYRAGTPSVPGHFQRVTRYSSANDKEWFAEHFVAWLLDRDALKAFSPDMVKYIDEMVERALKQKP